MKKIVASVGLVALGASSLQTAHGQAMTATAAPNKPWNVFASLRGFYDDNISTLPDGPGKVGSLGFQISPGASLTIQNAQTSLKASYIYTFRYYEKKPVNNTGHYDQNHNFVMQLNHAFSERYAIGISDSFVVGQEPDLLRTSYNIADPQRIPGDNIRNYGTLTFDARLTPVVSMQLGYANTYFDYADSGYSYNPNPFFPGTASLSGTLDRMMHDIRLSARWQFSPQTTGLLGYQFRLTDFTGNEPIWAVGVLPPSAWVYSDSRNSRAHTVFLGVQHNFSPDFSGSLQAGASYWDYYNAPNNGDNLAPYVVGNLTYNYRPGSYVQLGLSVDRHPTDVTGNTANPTLDQGSFVIYTSVNHQFMPDLTGSVIAQFQDSIFIGGLYDGDTEQYFLLGLQVEYRFNTFLSADAGYNYDWVDSQIPSRAYDRNRVYIGIRASY